jgi:hypothetical protein
MAMSRHFFASSTVIADAGVPIEFRTTSATAADKPIPFKMRAMGAFQVSLRDFRDNGNYRTCAARDKYVQLTPESRHSLPRKYCPPRADCDQQCMRKGRLAAVLSSGYWWRIIPPFVIIGPTWGR